MGKRYKYPTSYRDRECPYCGLYFSPRGLNGHIRFKHPKRRTESSLEQILREDESIEILNKIYTDEGLKEAARLFLTEYLVNRAGPH